MKAWEAFEHSVGNTLESTLAGNVDRKVKGMSTFIYNIGRMTFAVKEFREKNSNNIRKNRR